MSKNNLERFIRKRYLSESETPLRIKLKGGANTSGKSDDK